MRKLKLCMVLGLLSALMLPPAAFGTSFFCGLNWEQVPVGCEMVEFDIKDYSMGKAYVLQPNDMYQSVGTLDGLTDTGVPPGAQVINKAQAGPEGIGNTLVGMTEDSWSIIQINQIRDSDTLQVLWDNVSDTDNEIFGLVYGGVDNFVHQGIQQTTSTVGFFVDIYIQPKGTFDTIGGGIATGSGDGTTTGRVAFDTYVGIGRDAAGNLLTGATHAIEAESTSGKEDEFFAGLLTDDVDGDGDIDGHQQAAFTPSISVPGAGNGTSSMFLDTVGGAWWDAVPGPHYPPPPCINMEAPQWFWNGAPHGDSFEGDLHSGQRFEPHTGAGDWLIESFDPTEGMMCVIPEPLTMVAVGMAVAGLGGYVRRRRIG